MTLFCVVDLSRAFQDCFEQDGGHRYSETIEQNVSIGYFVASTLNGPEKVLLSVEKNGEYIVPPQRRIHSLEILERIEDENRQYAPIVSILLYTLTGVIVASSFVVKFGSRRAKSKGIKQ